MAGNKGTRSGKSYKEYYGAYTAKAKSNRRRRLEKHLRDHPEDEQAQAALQAGPDYRRKKPYKKGGFFDEMKVKRDLGIIETDETPYPVIGPRDRHRLAKSRSHVLKIARRRAHGDKSLASPGKKSESAYAFEKEHEQSVSKKNRGKRKNRRKSKKKEVS